MRSRRELHVTREARQRYGLPPAAFNANGRVVSLDPTSAAAWAGLINGPRREAGMTLVTAGELAAGVALHEAAHVLIERLGFVEGGRSAVGAAVQAWRAVVGAEDADAFDLAFGAAYAGAGGTSPAPSSAGADARLEEVWLIDAALQNPGFASLMELFEHPLTTGRDWQRAAAAVESVFAGVALPGATVGRGAGLGAAGPGGRALEPAEGTLLWLLTLPRRREPNSLAGQLRVAVAAWSRYLGDLGDLLNHLLRAADLLAEEGKRAPAAPGPPPPPPSDFLAGDAGHGEARFTPDKAWMPEVAMVAKSTYVWLAQLARRYGVEVRRLDQVPDEALRELREDGFNALWLIGVWERSRASRNLKRARGQHDAGASAYALHDYVIAADLGGEPAFENLRARAAAAGVRLASDMVPNHTGLDSRWMVEHPEWFVQVAEPPYPGYSFTGANLADDPALEVRVEDGYYSGTDAAVVFERTDPGSGAKRYVYHGNDGTAMPWNDTAQLDYLREDVRQAVMATIEDVARRFPIIRFDAAMTLAKRHVQRLWHPLPGEGGAIPSRARFALSAAEFERLMPREFWRELVDRLADSAPDTLLLAEAFWLMEGFFVRELGMHRVYNSAFMHMLMREENAAYRRLLKTLLAFDPRILQRYVNFMSNPDEETARGQFGASDKYFGVATLLATLPGLPMFGHGQVEGLSEKYGMEYLAPRLDERPDPELVARHRRVIAPLLRARGAFAGADAFRLFDLLGESGVEESAYVFTNRPAPLSDATASLVAVNNSARPVAGMLRMSAPFSDRLRGGELRSERLSEALGLRGNHDRPVRLTPMVGGAATLVTQGELDDGLRLDLGPYEARVLVVAREPEAPPTFASAPPPPATKGRRPWRGDPRLAGGRAAARRRAAKRARR